MSPPPSPPRRHLLSLLALVALCFPPFLLASSSFPLPTIAIAAVSTANATASQHNLACALVPYGNGTDYHISCASVSNRSAQPHSYSYGGAGGGSTPFSAVVAGDGYLCSAGPTVSPPMALRWWDLEDSEEPSKRVYWGKALSAVSGGGEYVCGLVDERIQCWRWRSGTFPESLRFSAVAVGGGFVCGLAKDSGEVKCLGGLKKAVVRRQPKGSHAMLAAGERHACAVKADSGEVVCWGEAAAVAAASPSPSVVGRTVSSLAVGDAITCVLWGSWKVSCWPPEEAAPPRAVAQQQFVALEAKGKVVCGVLMSDYALVCWGPGVSAGAAGGGVSKVFDRVLPGPCAPWTSCACGVWSGSAPLCGGGAAAVCYPCGYNPAQMLSTPPASNSSRSRSKRRPSDLAIALISAGIGSGVLAAIAAVVAVYCLRRRRSGVSQDPGRIHAEPSCPVPRVERRLSALLSKGPNTTVEQFPLVVLRAVTDDFSPSQRIGSGSFGVVYRATLPDGREVAIKRAEQRRDAGAASSSVAARRATCHEVAFVSELSLLSRVNHKNLVRLLGFCADGGERILVYEYMPNGTLHDHLHKRPAPLSPPLASWPARLRLALGAARGIEYMHTYAVPPIIHRDIKSPNILLDDAWTAKVSDFGLSLLINDDLSGGGSDGDGGCNAGAGAGDDDEPCMTAGTVGYMDPEYYRLQHLTDKSDVYSFGVVLLELMSGCRVVQRYAESVTPKNVVEFAVPHILADDVVRVLDPRLPAPTPEEAEALAYVGYLAADCVGPVGCDRPSMTDVVDALERALAACGAAPLSRAGTGRRAPALSRSGTDQFDLTDTD